MSKTRIIAAASALAIAAAGTAFADTTVITTPSAPAPAPAPAATTTQTTVNGDGSVTTTRTQAMVVSRGTVMTGPGTRYETVEQVPQNTTIALDGCLASNDWCQVNYGGKTGWISARDIQVMQGNQAYAVAQAPETMRIQTLHYDKEKQTRNASAGLLAGAATGAAVGGPVGAAAGAVVGAASGLIATGPDKEVTTYVTAHPVAPVQYRGDIRTGVVVPDSVALTPVPHSKLSYFYADGQPVVVNPHNRTIVKVVN
ncbi:DUF1236 domain-containing protein [Acidimangrovimonas sediminis]|uniref:DUF1236 domain-containing protein n=1 Tax=Acidimangrovimonas sediminis TaxID=2056283 RepID=UPI000C809C78|nr:DUF1236 domain-containing protein [Acidimangrovimonas sediminis]